MPATKRFDIISILLYKSGWTYHRKLTGLEENGSNILNGIYYQ